MKKKTSNKKRKALILLSVIWAIVLFLCVFAVIPFSYGENGLKEFNPPLSQISLGMDIKGGIHAVFEANTTEKNEETEEMEPIENFAEKLNKSVEIMQERLRSYNRAEATVSKSGWNAVRVEIPELDNYSSVLTAISKTAKFEICYPDTKDPAETKGDVVLTGDSIRRVKVDVDSKGVYTLLVTLENDSQSTYGDATQWAANKGQSLRVWIDDAMFCELPVTERVNDGKLTLTGLSDEESASVLAMQLNTGALLVTLQSPTEFQSVPSMGETALDTILLIGGISLGLLLVAIFVVYRRFGFAINLSVLIFTFLYIVLLATLPWISLTAGGIVGIIMGYALLINANVSTLEKLKSEYRSGKSLTAAFDSGFKKSLWSILDSHAVALLACAALWFGSTFVKGFATTFFAGIILSALCSLLFTRIFVKKLLQIDNTPKKYNLHREVNEDYE